MSERRSDPRRSSDLIVEIWGRDDSGESFTQSVHARNISIAGALLDGVNHDIRTGDIVGITYEGRQARFRVVWAMDFGNPPTKRVAVHKVEGQDCPWQQELFVRAGK